MTVALSQTFTKKLIRCLLITLNKSIAKSNRVSMKTHQHQRSIKTLSITTPQHEKIFFSNDGHFGLWLLDICIQYDTVHKMCITIDLTMTE